MIRDFFVLEYLLSLVMVMAAMTLGATELLALATFGVGVGYWMRDYLGKAPLTVMSFYALLAGLWFGLGNFVGYLSYGGPYEGLFYKYEAEHTYFATAQAIASLGATIPLLAYDFLKKRKKPLLQPVGFEVSSEILLRFCLSLLLLGWLVRFAETTLRFLGTFGYFVWMGPNFAIFILNFHRLDKDVKFPAWANKLPVVVMLFDVIYFTLFSNMRNNIAWPLVAFFAPYILRKQVTLKRFAFGIVALIFFLLVFKGVGETRGRLFGRERINAIIQDSPLVASDFSSEGGDDDWGLMVLLARFSTFNQLSQVVRIVDVEGAYDGATLNYLKYVFIPRFIWAGKPLVTPGQWFAEKLGRGQAIGERFSNAINMTIPGELYLNFRWVGVVLGLILLGCLYALLWQTCGISEGRLNPVKETFAFMMIIQAVFGGSHLGGLINLVLCYLTSVIATLIFEPFLKFGSEKALSKARMGELKTSPK